MTDTQFDADEVRASATTLATIMSDMAAFDGLQTTGPTLGSFPAAQSLERLVDDRRTGVAEFSQQLQAVLAGLHRGLTGAANDLERADRRNAAQLGSPGGDVGES